MIVLYRNKEAKQWVFQKLLTCRCREMADNVQGQMRSQNSTKEIGQVRLKSAAGCLDTAV